MAEVVGIVLGVGGLAGLFGATVDAFDQIKAAKSFSRDYEILSTRYDIRRATFLQWGAAVGLSGDGTSKMHPGLGRSATRQLVKRALNCIQFLLSDADDLHVRYGLEQLQVQVQDDDDAIALLGTSLSRQRLQNFKTSYTRFRSNIKDRQKATSIVRKTQWAIFDGRDFRKLLQDLDDMIGDLYKLVPVSLADQARLIGEDALSLPNDINLLKLVKQALAEDEASHQHKDLYNGTPLSRVPEMEPSASYGTAPPTQSFMDSVMSPSRHAHSPAFASLASSNASWVTALSHRASVIEATSSNKLEHSTPAPSADYTFGICQSTHSMLRGVPIETVFTEVQVRGNERELCCLHLNCDFSVPFRGRGVLKGTGFEFGRLERKIEFGPTFLAKSHIRHPATSWGLDKSTSWGLDKPASWKLMEYRCLFCKLMNKDSLGPHIFTGSEALLTHVSDHAGENVTGTILEGTFTLFDHEFERSWPNFDIKFHNVDHSVQQPNQSVSSHPRVDLPNKRGMNKEGQTQWPLPKTRQKAARGE